MGEKGGVVGGKIILQVTGHDELEKERNASIFTFVTNRFSMSYRWARKRASFGIQKMPFQKSIGNLSYKRVVLTVIQSPVNYSFSMYELFPRCVSLYI